MLIRGYIVGIDRWVCFSDGAISNHLFFKNKIAAMRCLKKNPRRGQIDATITFRRGKVERRALAWWNNNKIVKDIYWEIKQ